MIKKLTLLIFTFGALSVYGQNKESVSIHNNDKIQIGIYFSSDICYRMLKENEANDTSATSFITYRNLTEEQKTGFTTAISFNYKLSKKFYFETGLQYSNKGYQVYNRYLLGMQNDSIELNSIFKDNFQYISIPIKFYAYLSKKKVSFFTSFGISADYLIRANNSVVIKSDNLDTYKSTNPSQYNYNLFNITPFVSCGVDYQVNSKMNVLLEPMFSYSIMQIIDDQPITGYLWNSGLRLSFQVKI